jgi:hypothetical protein
MDTYLQIGTSKAGVYILNQISSLTTSKDIGRSKASHSLSGRPNRYTGSGIPDEHTHHLVYLTGTAEKVRLSGLPDT